METVSTAGVVLELLETISQLPPLADAVKGSAPAEEFSVISASAGAEPNC
jgi:hypothetical protein